MYSPRVKELPYNLKDIIYVQIRTMPKSENINVS